MGMEEGTAHGKATGGKKMRDGTMNAEPMASRARTRAR
jgi:hypothetical protein